MTEPATARAGAEAQDRVAVTVTFLRMERPPADPAPPFAEPVNLVRLAAPSVGFYRYLYDSVGQSHLWWLRRMVPDAELAELLADPRISVHVLYRAGEPAGFFELDASYWPLVNLSYFGLLPAAIGRGLGYALLRRAVDEVWGRGARGMTVNTCTADHPRALPAYLRAGFRPVRQIREIWEIPRRLGFTIPDRLRA